MGRMASGTFRLKGKKLQELTREKVGLNPHRVSIRAGISYSTVDRYYKSAEIDAISLEALYGVLIDGIGLSETEVKNMRVGDLFDLVRHNGNNAR